MVWINCPRNIEDHHCANEELGDWLDGAPDPSECSGACDGQLNVLEYDDDPSPAGISLSPGSYTYIEVDDQTCECLLTDAELEVAYTRARKVDADQLEDYYEERARAAIDGNDY